MRLNRVSNKMNKNAGAALNHYVGGMSAALVRGKAERDIRQARAAAEAAIRVRSSFLENMNHELRTPLNAIIGFAEMLKTSDELRLNERQKINYADYILQSADLLLAHINTILEVAAFDNGSVEAHNDATDLATVINYALNKVDIRAKTAKVSIQSQHLEEGVSAENIVWADEVCLGQAIEHLLNTAIDSCSSGGKILMRIITNKEGWAELQIRDNGSGFKEEEIEQAFNAFGERQMVLDKPFSGPGVGLAIAHTFVTLQGGRLKVKSRVGKGSLFSIALPIAEEKPQTSSFEDNQINNELKSASNVKETVRYENHVQIAKSA